MRAVALKCPKCGSEKLVPMDKSDPPGTQCVIVKCPKCFVEDDLDEITYFNKSGKRIFPS